MNLPDVTVVGIGADGWSGLPETSRHRVCAADVLLGGARHLAMVPHVDRQVRRPWPTPMTNLPGLLADHAAADVVALASGDPLLSGIATTLRRHLGDRVTVVPAVSSVALARARMCWSAEETAVVTLVGRAPETVRREFSPGRRILVLSSDESTPAAVAGLLAEDGYAASRLTVLGDLGGPHETRASGTADAIAAWGRNLPRLHVLAIEVDGRSGAGGISWAAGLPDDHFGHDGQLTKRDARASALARLEPRPGQVLWDVGAGAGSVAIEWLRAHPTCRAIAVEARAERAARIRHNARALGVPALEVVEGAAPGVLANLPVPDAIFVGGGATEPGLLDRCRDALAPGGRLVVHGVTLETEQLLVTAYAARGGELTRIAVEHAAPIGDRFTGWRPARAVTQWAWHKPVVPDEKHPKPADPGAFRKGLSREEAR